MLIAKTLLSVHRYAVPAAGGICQKCYGDDLAFGSDVALGEAVVSLPPRLSVNQGPS